MYFKNTYVFAGVLNRKEKYTRLRKKITKEKATN